MFRGLIEFRGTTIMKAFFINSIIVGIIAALTIETRRKLDEANFKSYLPQEYHKVLVTMVFSTLVGILTLIVMRLVFGTYAGALDGKRINYFI